MKYYQFDKFSSSDNHFPQVCAYLTEILPVWVHLNLALSGELMQKNQFILFCFNMFLVCFLQILGLMVGANISPDQLSYIAERTILESDKDNDRSISREEFLKVSF